MIDYDLTRIKALVFDVDGVLSDTTMSMDSNGIPLRTVNTKDGYAIQLAVKLGLHIVIITGGNSPSIAKRYEGLGVKEDEVLYMGDDIPDYEVMQVCGLPCCPSDAVAEIQQTARYVSPYSGGKGCARDVIEQVLRAQGLWKMDKVAFGW